MKHLRGDQMGFPGDSAGKEFACNAGTWVGKIPWRRDRLPTPVFFPGEFHELYSPWGYKESVTTDQLSLHFTSFSGNTVPPTMNTTYPSHLHCALLYRYALTILTYKVWMTHAWCTHTYMWLHKTTCVTAYVSVQLLSHVQLFVTPWTAVHQASLSLTNSLSLLKLMSIKSVMPSNHFILSPHLFLLPSIFPRVRDFSNESVLCNRWPKHWSFSFSISPSNEYSGLISMRIDWLDLLPVQGALKSLLQHHNLKESILWCSAFFIVQLSHPYVTTGKTIALTKWTLVG